MPQENFKIESSDLTISAVFKDFYTVPDFQREYVWQPEDVEKLLQDVHDEFYDEHERLTDGPEYFLGTIVGCKDENGIYRLIDGQQRVTTLYLVLCAARDIFAEIASERMTLEVLEAQLANTYLDARGAPIKRQRLTLQYEDSDGILEKIVKRSEPIASIVPKTDSVQNILNAYETILTFYNEHFDQKPDELRKFVAAFTNRIKLIRIVTPSITNALKVFETINDRGVGLNAMDLLKNLLFMKTLQSDYPKLKQKWKTLIDSLDNSGEKPLRFLRYYIMASYPSDHVIREDEIYDWFSKNSEKCGIDKNPIGFSDELIECAKAYENFIDGKNVDGKDNRFLKNIMLLSGALRQQNILLIAARKLNAAQFDRLCRSIENLIFCYLVTREPTRNFEYNFAKWSGELRSITSDQQLDEFLQKYFISYMESRARQFDYALKELDANNMQQYRLKYVLAKLSQCIEENAWGSPKYAQLDGYTDKSVHIEHILPQTPEPEVKAAFDKPDQYDSYVSKLGNLTLLEKTINTSISNDAYDKKVPGYKQSSFLLTKSIAEKPQVGQNTSLNRAVENLVSFDKWDSNSIEIRQQVLCDLARKVWEIPDAA